MAETSAVELSESILHDVFGYESFRGQQLDVVSSVTAGRDALVLMPTGGGKSLCFQIPAMVRPGTGLVISPLIALMRDQVEALQQNGVRAAYLNSSLDWESALEVERQFASGRPRPVVRCARARALGADGPTVKKRKAVIDRY